ncbi:Uncharacterised protein [Leclercia adecarboxylata]|uniref:Uncharacterized protein n=1 Tax=Leclercia adecarboxylata TaxID=83655 RepID=A0A4U9HSH1_9ENTR|nr:Uncharacterised protein [Leclercia adecarboxylata]
MITICKTCGTSYDVAREPQQCAICEDERQYVPATGQEWVDFTTLTTTHTNKWQQLEDGLFEPQNRSRLCHKPAGDPAANPAG